MDKEIQHNRLRYLIGFLVVVLLLYIGVLYNLQVVNYDYYSAQAVYSIAREEYVEASSLHAGLRFAYDLILDHF